MTPAAVVEVRTGGRAGDRAEAAPGRPVRVGRAKPAELVVPDDPLLSAAHFAVEVEAGGCRVRDLGSRFGTFLRGGRVADAELRDGDEIVAGRTTFGVRVADIAAVAPPPVAAPAPAAVEAAAPTTVPAGRGGVRAWLAGRRDLYALLDAAREPSVPERLAKSGEEHASLYDGEKGRELAPFGPWLVRLPPGSKLLDELVAEGWGSGWGVYLTCDKPLAEVRRHLRRFLMVRLPDGDEAYFRYYDPQVLRTFLIACDLKEGAVFFGPLAEVIAEDDGRAVVWRITGGVLGNNRVG